MPKIMKCSICNTELGIITKGKYKKDIAFLCGTCNYKILLDNNNNNKNSKFSNDILNQFNDIFSKK